MSRLSLGLTAECAAVAVAAPVASAQSTSTGDRRVGSSSGSVGASPLTPVTYDEPSTTL